MNVTSEKLREDTLEFIEFLQKERDKAERKYKEYRQAMNEDKSMMSKKYIDSRHAMYVEKGKIDKLHDKINRNRADCELFNKHGYTYAKVCDFYNNAMRKIYETIPNICTSLSMRLIDKAMTRGANIFEGYNTIDELKTLNKSMLIVFNNVEMEIGGNTFKNFEFFQRTLMNRIADRERGVY